MKVLKYSLFITLELSLLFIIVVLAFKISNLYNGQVKGVQYVSIIKKDNVIFETENKKLKYFYEPKPNTVELLKPDWLGYEVKNTINSDSLNESKEYSIHKPINTYRIITLGDSFTYGWYVNSGENWSDILEELLNKQLKCKDYQKFEVINLGVPGYDIEYIVERYKKRGIKYNPDLVMWFINAGNFMKINENKLPLEEKLKKEGVPIFDNATGLYSASEKAKGLLREQMGSETITKYQENRMYQFASVYRGKLLIVTFPDFPDVYKSIIKKFITGNTNYSYYGSLLTTDYDNKSLQLLDGHPDREGHKEIAEDILRYLSNNVLTDCILLKI